MKTVLGLSGLSVIAPGLGNEPGRMAWVRSPLAVPVGDLQFEKKLPMMVARRMAPGSRLAAEIAVAALEAGHVDALIFTSRHGESPRGEKLLSLIAEAQPLSPTDFMMSVHNAAVGMVTIAKRQHLPTSSISSGADSFHAGVVEALGMLMDGFERVLLVDFENALPPMIKAGFEPMPDFAYAVGVVIEKTGDWTLSMDWTGSATQEPAVPSSLGFAHGFLGEASAFTTHGAMSSFTWRRG